MLGFAAVSQTNYLITGKVTEASGSKPIANATIHLKGTSISTASKADGAFHFITTQWNDTLEITCINFEPYFLVLHKGHLTNLAINMTSKVNALDKVVVSVSKKPGKALMQRVIDAKSKNNPSRFLNYSYQRYTRNELDIDNIDFKKAKGSGMKSIMLNTYSGIDSSAKYDKELPVYFEERLANNYHAVSPAIDRENIIAKKTLGLKTDNLLTKLDKYYFNFNLYDEWVPIFDQTYISPISTKAFSYYNFFEGEKIVEYGDTLEQVLFTPQRQFERAFSGTIWINTQTLAIATINIRLSKTANLNFVSNITYYEEYKQQYDSISGKFVYMPYKFNSEVKFESGLAILGLPVPDSKNSLKFIVKNSTVVDKIKVNIPEDNSIIVASINKELTSNWNKPDSFWREYRADPLTNHEINIYKMVDSLKQNKRFQRDAKLIAFAGTGFWDFGKYFRVGPYSSFLSKNTIEGYRMRLGFWTMPGINKKLNLFGYGAYGFKDEKLKGMVGLKYIWNEAKWTKTTVSYGSDYDFIIDQDDELDKDNIINSLLRKDVPYTRISVKQVMLKHEQYISPDFSFKTVFNYEELDPVFDFTYRPPLRANRRTFSSVFTKTLPFAQGSIALRYAHKEKSVLLNYDKIRLGTFSPIVTATYTYGFPFDKALFDYHGVDLSIEHRLRLPPKMMLYYKVQNGFIAGTLPYLLLNIPAGNEYYVSSKYSFNTMIPYEFAADKYVSIHTRFYLGGTLFDKIPLLQKWGWRERFSFNAYEGDMTDNNIQYNKHTRINQTDKAPFMEAGAGIENIFHILSIEYYRRLNYLDHRYAKKGGIYTGLTLSF